MSAEQWLAMYDNSKNQFKWFIDQYFPGMFQQLDALRKQGKWSKMLNHMNDMWYKLPGSKFNIVEKPQGWTQFLNLVENPPSEDGPVDMSIK